MSFKHEEVNLRLYPVGHVFLIEEWDNDEFKLIIITANDQSGFQFKYLKSGEFCLFSTKSPTWTIDAHPL